MSRRRSVHGKGMRKDSSARRVAVSAVLTALAMIFSYIEAIIPFNFGIPGIKLGLSNLVVLVALYSLGAGYAFVVNLTRIVLSGLLFSGVSAMLYSLSGGMLSFVVMLFLSRLDLFSPAGVSMAGGVSHNIGQITLAAIITETAKIYLYLPVLMISGTVTGLVLGIAGSMILERMGHLKGGNRIYAHVRTEGDDQDVSHSS